MRTKSHVCAQFVVTFILKKCDFEKHIESVHDHFKLQKCSICDFNCSKSAYWVNLGKKQSYKCSISNFGFPQKASLKIHISAQFVIIFVLENVILKHTECSS